jgi:hypothetical protein
MTSAFLGAAFFDAAFLAGAAFALMPRWMKSNSDMATGAESASVYTNGRNLDSWASQTD